MVVDMFFAFEFSSSSDVPDNEKVWLKDVDAFGKTNRLFWEKDPSG